MHAVDLSTHLLDLRRPRFLGHLASPGAPPAAAAGHVAEQQQHMSI